MALWLSLILRIVIQLIRNIRDILMRSEIKVYLTDHFVDMTTASSQSHWVFQSFASKSCDRSSSPSASRVVRPGLGWTRSVGVLRVRRRTTTQGIRIRRLIRRTTRTRYAWVGLTYVTSHSRWKTLAKSGRLSNQAVSDRQPVTRHLSHSGTHWPTAVVSWSERT